MNVPGDLHYSASHEWLRLNDDGSLTIGITDYAQEQLGDVVYAETPVVDRQCRAEEAIAVVESVKAASDIYAPISGTITDTNAALTDSPELINESPYADGWIFRMLPSDEDELDKLMDADGYVQFLESQS